MFSGKLSWNCYLTVCFGIVCLVLKVNSEVKTHHVDSGESVTLECEVAAPDVDVPFIVQWKKQGIDAPIYLKFENYPAHIDPQFYGRVSLFDQASLQIVNVQAEDDGWYECKVMFLNGEHDQLKNGTWARLRVRAPPAFAETSPSRVIFAPGSDMTLLCRTTGNPPPTITWYKDEQLIKPGPRTTFVDGSITLYKVGVGDSGAYTCTAESNAGTSTHVIRVIIQGPPHFVIEPANVTVQEDGQALFECVAEGAPSSINYRWYKDNVEIERLTNLNHRLQMLLEGSLLIHTVRPSDEGVFTCRPDNGVGVPPSASAHLTVLYPAYVPKMPATSYLPKGLKGIIHCPIRANPPPTRVEWTKDWKDLLPDELPRYSVAKNGHLEIKDVEKEDEGRYTCIPHNALGTRGESLPTYVFVEDPPYFTDRPRSVYQREVGQQVTFPCAAKGNPEPTIKWRKADGTEPADRAYYNNGRLTISYLRKEDHGKYECIAENVVATVVTVTELIIESTTPHAPTNITILAGIYTAMVSWVPAYNGGFPQHYEIWYKKLHADVELWDKVTIADEHATSVILYNLDPSTIYEVSVIAKNTLGDSLFSDVMLMTTKEPGQYVPIPTDHTGLLARLPAHGPTGTRPNPPQSVSVNETETGLVIHWQAPPNASKPIVQYIIEYRIGDQEWQILEDNIPASQLMYIPDDLEPSTHYSFRVFSLTETAFSEPSQVVLAYTGDIPVYYSQDEFPTPMVAAIVGALCFLVVISLLATVGILRLHRKRKDKKHVSFADSVEAANRRTDKRTKTDSNDSAPKRTQLPKLKPLLTPFFSRLKEKYQKRGLRRKMKKKGNWSTSSGLKQNKGVTAKETMLVEKSRFPKKYKVSSHRVEVSYSGPISWISRSADGKFVLRPENEYVDDVVQSRPDLLPDYHDDMAGVFAASSESTTSFTTDENCSATITGSTDSQLKPPPPPPGPKVTYVAPQTAYKPEGAQLASSPAEQHDAKPLKIDDVSALRVSPSEISGWEKWTKEEVYEIMHRMQELGYESAYGGYDLESEMNENDDFDLESVRYSEKSDSYSQFANVCANGYPPFAQSYEQLGRPRVAANFGRPHSSMVELMSRGPSERTPIYSPTRPNANPITPSTLQNFSSIRASPDSSSQHTISVDVHRTDEDSQMAGAGDYVRIRSPQYHDEHRMNSLTRRNEDTPVAPIKPMRCVDSAESDGSDTNLLMLSKAELKSIANSQLLARSNDTIDTSDTLQETIKERTPTITNLRDALPTLDNISNGHSSVASRASITSTNSSGRGSRTTTLSRSSRGGSLHHQESSFTPSISSGIGSNAATQSVASWHPRSVSQLSDQTSLDSPFSENTSPFTLHQKDNSIDENYEFDTQPLHSELLAALKQFSAKSSHSKPSSKKSIMGYRKKGFEPRTRDFYMPKLKSLPQYEDTEARCAKLKEEFLEYRRKQKVESRESSLSDEHEPSYETTTMV